MSVDRRLVNLGIFLLILGAIPLAVSQGWIARETISHAWELWPLILIGIGIGLILRRTPFHFAGGLLVAATVGKGIIDPAIVDHYVVFGALVGAIFWNIITWYFGIPSSSSHALIGGLAGAAVAKGGVDTLVVSCPKDLVMFQDALKTTQLERALAVKDIVQLVESAGATVVRSDAHAHA